MGAKQLYSLDYLMEISGNDKEFVKQMLETFLVDAPAMISDMRVYHAKRDLKMLRETAHKLLTPMAYVGARKYIEKDISEIEDRAIENRDIEGVASIIDIVEKSCNELFSAIKKDFNI